MNLPTTLIWTLHFDSDMDPQSARLEGFHGNPSRVSLIGFAPGALQDHDNEMMRTRISVFFFGGDGSRPGYKKPNAWNNFDFITLGYIIVYNNSRDMELHSHN